eukprot:4445097-Pyramimonas_sp.AAC.1
MSPRNGHGPLQDDAEGVEGEKGAPKKNTRKRLQLRRITTRTRPDGTRQVRRQSDSQTVGQSDSRTVGQSDRCRVVRVRTGIACTQTRPLHVL